MKKCADLRANISTASLLLASGYRMGSRCRFKTINVEAYELAGAVGYNLCIYHHTQPRNISTNESQQHPRPIFNLSRLIARPSSIRVTGAYAAAYVVPNKHATPRHATPRHATPHHHTALPTTAQHERSSHIHTRLPRNNSTRMQPPCHAGLHATSRHIERRWTTTTNNEQRTTNNEQRTTVTKQADEKGRAKSSDNSYIVIPIKG